MRNQIAIAMLWVVLEARRAVTNGAGKRLAGFGAKEQHAKTSGFRFHVIRRSRFIFR